MAIEKLKEYIDSMKKEGLIGYAMSIEQLLPNLCDKPAPHILTETEKDMKGYCERILETLEQFGEGKMYDTKEQKMIDSSECDYDGERYQYFCDYYLYDNFGLRVVYDLCGGDKAYRSCKICVAIGGPGIWIDTETGNIEGYWWGKRCSVPMPKYIIDMIDEEVESLLDGWY